MNPPTELTLRIDSDGIVHCLYSETIDLHALGTAVVTRASHVEPDEAGRWWADLSPVAGPSLGPFDARSIALAAEHHWLLKHWLLKDWLLKDSLLPRALGTST